MRTYQLITLVLSIHTLAHVYMAWRLLPSLVHSSWGWAVSIVLVVVSWLFIPLSIVADELVTKQQLQDTLVWVGAICMAFTSSLFILTLLRDIFLLVVRVIASSSAVFYSSSAWGILLLSGIVSVIGFMVARGPAQVEQVTIPVKNYQADLANLKIVQISDIHVGPTIKRDFLARIVSQVNQLKPDVVVITGDLVDGSVEHLQHDTDVLRELEAPLGVFYISGNHEYYSGVEPWLQEVRRLGIRVLENEHEVIRIGDASVTIAGVRDYSAQKFNLHKPSNPYEAIAGAPRDSLKILLAHQPRSAPSAAAAGFDVQLSGHTHGGQFWPWNAFVKLQQPFVQGLHKWEAMWVYVNRGTGYWGPPNRFGVSPEITDIRFSAEK